MIDGCLTGTGLGLTELQHLLESTPALGDQGPLCTVHSVPDLPHGGVLELNRSVGQTARQNSTLGNTHHAGCQGGQDHTSCKEPKALGGLPSRCPYSGPLPPSSPQNLPSCWVRVHVVTLPLVYWQALFQLPDYFSLPIP